MTGFSLFNSSGHSLIDGESRTTRVTRTQTISAVSGVGEVPIPNPFVPSNSFGNISFFENPPSPLWLRLGAGKAAFMGGGFMSNGGTLAVTRKDAPISSGYLDVFDASGQLVWSAVSANSTPRIKGLIRLNAATPIDDGAVHTVYVGATPPWVLTSTLAGDINVDESGTIYAGLVVYYDGANLKFSWVRGGGGKSFNPTCTAQGGLHIPYATIPSLDL